MSRRFVLLWILIVPGVHFAGAQAVSDFSDSAVVSRLRQDVYSLASEEMEGREAGTRGERLAAHYIKLQMEEAGLLPLFDTTYFQSFTFPGEWIWGANNKLQVGNTSFVHEQHFYTLPGSGSATISGQWIDAGCGDDIQGLYAQGLSLREKIWVMEYYPCSDKPSDDGTQRKSSRNQRLTAAVKEGAKAVIFVNRSSEREEPSLDLRFTGRNYDIPVVFAGKELKELLFNKPNTEVVLSADIERGFYESVNVAGYIDNQAATTVVIGGHLDHIGFGGQASREPGVHSIHYGADDNASGIAVMLYLASRLSEGIHTSNNYIFIAFSGEEKGLWGSGYWTRNPTAVSIDELNYMLNFDMVGRLSDERKLMINGTGTSSLWERRLPRANRSNLDLTFSQSGIGGSDHTSFYLVDVPAIHFFTGLHDDYHRPADTPDKINFPGMQEVGSFALNLIGSLDGEGKLDFSKTQQEESRMAPRFTVSLGVIPAYMYSGSGLKIEGVTSGNPAEKAGLQRGDVIIKIGDKDIADIYDYMESLSEFIAGDEAELHYKRDGEVIKTKVEF